jgi:hypothetical protein
VNTTGRYTGMLLQINKLVMKRKTLRVTFEGERTLYGVREGANANAEQTLNVAVFFVFLDRYVGLDCHSMGWGDMR